MPNNNGQGPSWIDTNETDEKYINKLEVALFAAWKTLQFLHEYTYTDAEGPELRSQNQRVCSMTQETMKKIEELK